MKKLIDAIFLSLPPIVASILAIILLDFNPDGSSSLSVFMAAFFAFLGVPMILFSKNLANLAARQHSFWHSLYYKDNNSSQGKERPMKNDIFQQKEKCKKMGTI